MTQEDDSESENVSYKIRVVIDKKTLDSFKELKLKTSMAVIDYLSNMNSPKGVAIRTLGYILLPNINLVLFSFLPRLKMF